MTETLNDIQKMIDIYIKRWVGFEIHDNSLAKEIEKYIINNFVKRL